MLHRFLAAGCALVVAVLPSGCGDKAHVSKDADVVSFAGMSWQVTDGSWHAAGDAVTGSGGHLATADEFTNGSIDVDVETPDMGDRTVGIGFHVSGSKGQNGYAFNFTAAQTFNVFKGTDDNWQPVRPEMTTFQRSDALAPNRNHVHIEMTGGQYRVWVNGQQLADFQDAAYPRGRFNLWVESSAWTVTFSNLRIAQEPV